MQNLTIEQMIEKIRKEEFFEAEAADKSFFIRVQKYEPFLCAAIHDGHGFRAELLDKTQLTDYERWYEEDPHTLDFITDMPIVMAGRDSRYEYDLNRDEAGAIYTEAWGKLVWKEPLTDDVRERSLSKHRNFYRVVHALVGKLEQKFGACVVYDVHSYNWKRRGPQAPMFNLGTELVNQQKFGTAIQHWADLLATMTFPRNIVNRVAINEVFQGKGNFLKSITNTFSNTLVYATEFKKEYCDELERESYMDVVQSIQKQFQELIHRNNEWFFKQFTNYK